MKTQPLEKIRGYRPDNWNEPEEELRDTRRR